MAAEGEFPKSDGDIWFASEANSIVVTRGAVYGGGSDINLTGSQTHYFYPNQSKTRGTAADAAATTENVHRNIIPFSGVLKDFYTAVRGTNNTTNNTTITIIVNGSASIITVTHADGVLGVQNDLSNEVSVTAGDTISIRVAQGGAGNFQGFHWGFSLTGA